MTLCYNYNQEFCSTFLLMVLVQLMVIRQQIDRNIDRQTDRQIDTVHVPIDDTSTVDGDKVGTVIYLDGNIDRQMFLLMVQLIRIMNAHQFIQIDGKIVRGADKQSKKCTSVYVVNYRQINRRKDRQTERQIDRQTDIYIDRQIDIQTDRQIDRQIDRQENRCFIIYIVLYLLWNCQNYVNFAQ